MPTPPPAGAPSRPKAPLSDAAIRNLKPEARPYKVADGGGLHLLVETTGGRLWRLAYRYGGKQKQLAIGRYPTVGLAAARAAREQAKKDLSDGLDPNVRKREAKAAARRSQDPDRTFQRV